MILLSELISLVENDEDYLRVQKGLQIVSCSVSESGNMFIEYRLYVNQPIDILVSTSVFIK